MTEPSDASSGGRPLAESWSSGGGPRRSRPLVLAALVAAAVAVAGAAGFLVVREDAPEPSPQGPGSETGRIQLAVAFGEGETYRYRFAVTMDGSAEALDAARPIDLRVTQVVALEVLSVSTAEVATARATIERMTGTVNGEAVRVVKDEVVGKLRITRQGRIAGASGLGLGASASAGPAIPGMEQFLPLLPERPVGPGDTWEREVVQEVPYGTGKLRSSHRSEFLGYEPVDGVRGALVRTAFSSPLDLVIDLGELTDAFPAGAGILPGSALRPAEYDGAVEGRQFVWLDPRTGQPLRGTASADFDITLRFRGDRSVALPEVGLRGRIGWRMEPA